MGARIQTGILIPCYINEYNLLVVGRFSAASEERN